MNILVVDDEALIRHYIAQCILDTGIEIHHLEQARSGAGALEYLEKNRTDLVFADITMPKMNGIELAKLIKSKYPYIDIVMLTCHEDFSYVREAMKNNASDYILKSEISIGFFAKYLREYIKKKMKNNIGDAVEFGQILLRAGSSGAEQNWTECVCELEKSLNYIKEARVEPKNVSVGIMQFLETLKSNGVLILVDYENEFKHEISAKNSSDILEKMIDELKKKKNLYSRVIEDALSYLQKHYNEKISIQNVADEIYVSSGYLSKRFRSEVGIGFAEYLQKMRLEQAYFLIRTTNMKISDIAIEVGINNFSYFSSLFLKTYGMSPLEVRKSRTK